MRLALAFSALAAAALVTGACGGGSAGKTSAQVAGGNSSGGSGSSEAGSAGVAQSAAGDDRGGSAGEATGGASACEPFGHYGAPGTTFTLPTGDSLYFPDLQKSFPNVAWATLDRLYLPAGKYKAVDLGNLPMRDASHPLVITNHGGQVQVGPNDPGAGYIWSVDGGSNWVITGRYDADSGTGDAAFPGHRCGAYAGSRGHYGIVSDDEFAQGQYLHMGIAVSTASDFELEYLEIMRSGFAGIRVLNSRAAGDPAFPAANVRIHDNYVHDTGGEGFYLGWTGDPPANLLPGLRVYNNRIIRTGNEALQIQDLGDGTEVSHNVMAFGAMHWRDNGLGNYQDNNSQVQTREGTISLHDNVFVGGASTLLSFWSQPEDGDGARHVTFEHNYFGATRSLGAYLGGAADAASSFTFSGNFFTDLDFSYDQLDPTATDPGTVFGISADYTSPIAFQNNTWQGMKLLVSGLSSGNGTSNSVTGTGNVNTNVASIQFVASGYPNGASFTNLEAWAPKATLAPGSPDITYQVGDLVLYNADLFRCLQVNTGVTPSDHADDWQKLPAPTDDFRVAPSSPYAGIGVQ
jgi:hypothetical protein